MATTDPSKLTAIISFVISSFELIGKTIQFGNKVKRGFASEGLYEVLDYQTVLEILDIKGRKAKIIKQEQIRFLQNGVAAIEDEAWGDGRFLEDYQVSPGKAVDFYRKGFRTVILISLRSIKNIGDLETIDISRNIKNGFARKIEQWESIVNHRTKRLRIKVILPKLRGPKSATLFLQHRRKTGKEPEIQQLPNGRWEISATVERPHLYETYILNWDW